jgi:hypothetical protein
MRRSALLSFFAAALSVQQAVSLPFDKRADQANQTSKFPSGVYKYMHFSKLNSLEYSFYLILS